MEIDRIQPVLVQQESDHIRQLPGVLGVNNGKDVDVEELLLRKKADRFQNVPVQAGAVAQAVVNRLESVQGNAKIFQSRLFELMNPFDRQQRSVCCENREKTPLCNPGREFHEVRMQKRLSAGQDDFLSAGQPSGETVDQIERRFTRKKNRLRFSASAHPAMKIALGSDAEYYKTGNKISIGRARGVAVFLHCRRMDTPVFGLDVQSDSIEPNRGRTR